MPRVHGNYHVSVCKCKWLELMATGAKALFSKMSRDEFETRQHRDDVTGNPNYAALCQSLVPMVAGWSDLTVCRETDERPCVTPLQSRDSGG